MKKLILILSVFFFVVGCGEEDVSVTKQGSSNTIMGTWKKVGEWEGGMGSIPDRWTPVQDGAVISFKEDGIFLHSKIDCEGTYSLRGDNSVDLTLPCIHSTNVLPHVYGFKENGDLTLTSGCEEGCYDQYTKVN